jgi:hypothetical protein
MNTFVGFKYYNHPSPSSLGLIQDGAYIFWIFCVSIYFVLGWREQPSQDKILLYRHDQHNEPTKEEPPSFVLCKSPFGNLPQFQHSEWVTRETREEWPQLRLLKLRWMGTVRGQMRGVLPWLVRWACCSVTKDFCSALASLIGQVQKIFLIEHFFKNFLSPSHCKL